MINPALSTNPYALNNQAPSVAPPPVDKMTDKTSTQQSGGGHSTVTLSDAGQQLAAGKATDLQSTQRVVNQTATESRMIEDTDTQNQLSGMADARNKADLYASIQQMGR